MNQGWRPRAGEFAGVTRRVGGRTIPVKVYVQEILEDNVRARVHYPRGWMPEVRNHFIRSLFQWDRVPARFTSCIFCDTRIPPYVDKCPNCKGPAS